MSVERTDPPFVNDERPMLDAWLDFQRATLEMKCDGLTPGQLRERAVPPSSLSLLGLVRHMAEVERGWFQRAFANEETPPLYYSEDDPDGDFNNIDDADPEEAFAAWHEACDRARAIAASAPSLDEIAQNPRNRDQISLRWILVHMIEEYARHNGHADFLRERIDGSVGN
jgi:uncharacterized damage-inducible protein DinB